MKKNCKTLLCPRLLNSDSSNFGSLQHHSKHINSLTSGPTDLETWDCLLDKVPTPGHTLTVSEKHSASITETVIARVRGRD